jgi:uncharacterized protein YndB with AHSA1/START domain
VVARVGQQYGARVTRISETVTVDAPAKEVWDVVSDPRHLPKWDRHITKVLGVPPGGLEEGIEYSTVVTFFGVNAHVDAEVEEIRPPEYARIRLSGPVIQAIVTTEVEEIDDGRSGLTQSVDYRLRGGPLGRLASEALNVTGGPSKALRKGMLAQKEQVEER